MFAAVRNTQNRLGKKTGGIVVATPSGSTPVFIIKIGRRACGSKVSIIDGTSYAAGYLTPLTGIVRSGFKVLRKLVAAIRTIATARGAISNPSKGS